MWRAMLRKNNGATGWALAALFGLLLALAGARTQRPDHFQDQVPVWVNDRPITAMQLNRAERRLSALSGREVSDAQRRVLIDLLIDEELLLQRAETLGVVEADPGVRKTIVQAAIDGIVDEYMAKPPARHELEAFYWRHRAVFERPARVAVSALRFDDLTAARRARDAIAEGAAWADLKARPDVEPLSYLPESPLPGHVLRRYLGPSLAHAAQTLQPGEISQPLTGQGGAFLLRTAHAVYPSVPEFSEIEATVREEYLSRGREAALTRKLAQLWRAADIQFTARRVAERPGQYARQEAR